MALQRAHLVLSGQAKLKPALRAGALERGQYSESSWGPCSGGVKQQPERSARGRTAPYDAACAETQSGAWQASA